MNILLTGGTGFIGKALSQRLTNQGATLWILTRQILSSTSNVHFIQNLSQIKKEQVFDAVINLAGEPIAQRWTLHRRSLIRKSRVELTESLVKCLNHLENPPKTLISGSAIGFYGPQNDTPLTETATYQKSFSHQLCEDWEEAAKKISPNTRLCLLRTGVVLGQGGMLAKIRLTYKLGLGGPIGSGDQWISWIHLDDIVRAIEFILTDVTINGPINATAPNPVTNEEFSQTYANVLHRPSMMRTPGILLDMIMGEMAQELLLTGQKVIPQKLMEHHFTFLYPTLLEALKAIEASNQS